ncbi:MAG: putative transposase [Chlamydiales bacterium]|jgi:putative transposase
MPRKKRYHSTGSMYHVMLRGNNGQDIFVQENDFSKLSLLLQEGTERYNHKIFAFCFMSNHIHLVIKVSSASLSKIIQNVSFRYARYINGKYKRIGHLFQGRFRSILVDDAEYLKELVRYVHLNPVRAKIVSKPEDYYWSGHQAFLESSPFTWISTSETLRRFSTNPKEAHQRYIQFLYRGIDEEAPIDFKKGNQTGLDVLASDTFTQNLLLNDQTEPIFAPTPGEVCDFICITYNIKLLDLSGPSKNHRLSYYRSLIAYLVKQSNIGSFTNLSKILNRKKSALSELAIKIERLISNSSFDYEKIQQLKDELQSTLLKKDSVAS